MESIAEVLDREFPRELQVTHEVTMEQLAAMRDALRVLLPEHSKVELSVMMNVILLSVWAPGQGVVARQCLVRTRS